MFLDKQKQVRDDNDRKLHKIKINSPSLISQPWPGDGVHLPGVWGGRERS